MFLFLLIVVLPILLPLFITYRPPHFIIRYFQRRWPDVLWHVSTGKRLIALTVDDGPSEHTREILDILRCNDAAATFFIIGSHVPGREAILQDLIRQGNELGNHAMYDQPSRALSDGELVQQIKIVRKMLCHAYRAVGVSGEESVPCYFRPGSGFFSTRMRKAMIQLDHRLVLGSIYPHDPQIPFAKINARHILSMARPGGIIICHDCRPWTAPMLRMVLPELKRQGFRVVTVTELLKEASR
jgi:peptidoglycan/xylan/chitin deacetylase (PgdA/CDA1 family)